MIAYYDRRGNQLGQADAVPANAPLVRAPERVDPQPLTVVPLPDVEDPSPAPSRNVKILRVLGVSAVALGAIYLATMRKGK